MSDPTQYVRVPSQFADVLRPLRGRRIVGVSRYSWWPPPLALEKCRRAARELFGFTAGPALMQFDTGLALGLSSKSSLASVQIWVEYDETGLALTPKPLASEPDLYPILATDPVYADEFWHTVVGARVARIFILRRRPGSPKTRLLPNEAGLCFALDTGATIVAAHGLHNDTDDFALLSWIGIADRLRPELEELPLEGG